MKVLFYVYLGVVVAFLASAPAAEAGAPPVTGIYPEALRTAKRFELGELIRELMPDSSAKFVGWDHAIDTGVVWLSEGYELKRGPDGAERYVRVGVARVSVNGTVSTVIRRGRDELGWTVTLSSTDDPRFGPTQIQIEPGIPGEPCFGSRFDGCWFGEPVQSLRAAGIQTTKLCGKSMFQERITGFNLVVQGKKLTQLNWQQSGGSGGQTASITLNLGSEQSAVACRNATFADDVKMEASPATPALADGNVPPLKYKPSNAADAATLRELSIDTEICMHDTAVALLRQGLRNEQQLLATQVNICGGPLIQFLTRYAKTRVSADQARHTATERARRQLAQVIGTGR